MCQWLAQVTADQVERATGEGNFEPIAYEFLTQAGLNGSLGGLLRLSG